MNNDNRNPNGEVAKKNENIQKQQINPGGFPPFYRRPVPDEPIKNESIKNESIKNEPIKNVPPETPPPETTPVGPTQFPGMEDQPRSAPPDFIPETPRMERGTAPGGPGGPGGPEGTGPAQRRPGFFGGPGGFGRPGYREDWQTRRSELRGCLHRFTYIWLFNGEGFWFYPTLVDGQSVLGFRWRRNRWVFDRVFLRRLLYFRCY